MQLGNNVSFVIGPWLFLAAPPAPVSREIQDISTTETSVNVTLWHALQTNGPIR